jgi:hypothetical protein
MNAISKQTGCAARSWKLATISGVVVATLGMILFGWGVVMSILAGIVVAVGGGVGLIRMMCRDTDMVETETETVSAAPATTSTPASESAAKTIETPVVAPVAAPVESPVKASAVLPGQLELVARKGTWRYRGATG